jgi:hypothetical protein
MDYFLKRNKTTLLFVFCCTFFGVIAGLFYTYDNGYDYIKKYFYLLSGLSSLISGYFVWFLIVSRVKIFTYKRGMIAGFVSVIFAHWLTFLMIFIIAMVDYGLVKFPLEGVFLTIPLTIISFFLCGWVTIPSGMLFGVLVIFLTNKTKKME